MHSSHCFVFFPVARLARGGCLLLLLISAAFAHPVNLSSPQPPTTSPEGGSHVVFFINMRQLIDRLSGLAEMARDVLVSKVCSREVILLLVSSNSDRPVHFKTRSFGTHEQLQTTSACDLVFVVSSLAISSTHRQPCAVLHTCIQSCGLETSKTKNCRIRSCYKLCGHFYAV